MNIILIVLVTSSGYYSNLQSLNTLKNTTLFSTPDLRNRINTIRVLAVTAIMNMFFRIEEYRSLRTILRKEGTYVPGFDPNNLISYFDIRLLIAGQVLVLLAV
jgi:hypothetical protein